MKLSRKLSRITLILIIVSLNFSCEEEKLSTQPDNNLNLPSGSFFQPVITVEKGNNSVTVSIIDPRPFTNYSIVPTDPEYFEIFYSDDPENLVSAGSYAYPESEVVINDLINNTPLYFTVSSNQEGYRPYFSDTVMVVPSRIVQPFELFPGFDYPLSEYGSSGDLRFLAFESYDFINLDYSKSIIYNVNTLNDELTVVDEDANSISWANESNSFAYVTTVLQGSFLNSVRIKLFDAESNESTTLLDVENEGFNVVNPVFSPDDQLIAYLSNENSNESYNFNVWTIDLETNERRQVTDFESVNFSCYGYLNWSGDGESIYVSGNYYPSNDPGSIYRLNVATGQLSRVFQSDWTDRQSAISPDNQKIAFWSKRTGDWELWIYDLNTEGYQQITGGTTSYLFEPSKITWLSSSELALVGYANGGNKIVSVTTY